MKLAFLIVVAFSALTSFSQNDSRAALEETRREIKAAMQKSDLKTARRHAERAVEISVKLLQPDARELALAYENLATVLAADGKHKLAVQPLRDALRIFQTDPKRNGQDISKAMAKLGDALSLSGNRKEAEGLFSEAIASARQMFGDQSKEILNARAAQACFYLASDKDRAFTDFGEIYALAAKQFGKDGSELDEVALTCEGSFLTRFWEDERHPNLARKRLNALLGYEIGKPMNAQNADYGIRWSDIGTVDRQTASTVVKVWVDEKGNPKDVKMVFGPSRFADLSTTAARATRFKPSVQNGFPVSDVMYISYLFLR